MTSCQSVIVNTYCVCPFNYGVEWKEVFKGTILIIDKNKREKI